MPEGHLVSAPPLCPPCSAPQGQAESGGMVLVACARPVRREAALRDSVLCLPTDIHSLLVNKPSSSSSFSSSSSSSSGGGIYLKGTISAYLSCQGVSRSAWDTETSAPGRRTRPSGRALY